MNNDVCACVCECVRACVRACLHACIRACICACVRACVCVCVCVCLCLCVMCTSPDLQPTSAIVLPVIYVTNETLPVRLSCNATGAGPLVIHWSHAPLQTIPSVYEAFLTWNMSAMAPDSSNLQAIAEDYIPLDMFENQTTIDFTAMRNFSGYFRCQVMSFANLPANISMDVSYGTLVVQGKTKTNGHWLSGLKAKSIVVGAVILLSIDVQ